MTFQRHAPGGVDDPDVRRILEAHASENAHESRHFLVFAIAGEHQVDHETARKTLFLIAFDHITMLPCMMIRNRPNSWEQPLSIRDLRASALRERRADRHVLISLGLYHREYLLITDHNNKEPSFSLSLSSLISSTAISHWM